MSAPWPELRLGDTDISPVRLPDRASHGRASSRARDARQPRRDRRREPERPRKPKRRPDSDDEKGKPSRGGRVDILAFARPASRAGIAGNFLPLRACGVRLPAALVFPAEDTRRSICKVAGTDAPFVVLDGADHGLRRL